MPSVCHVTMLMILQLLMGYYKIRSWQTRCMDLLLSTDTQTCCCDMLLLLHEQAYINPVANLNRWSWRRWRVTEDKLRENTEPNNVNVKQASSLAACAM